MQTPQFARLPRHIGVIMDGNGRWAQQKSLTRVMGHQHATRSVRETVETCAALGVEVLTLYAFSTENWSRPQAEVDFLMSLFETYLVKELPTMTQNNIRLRLLGKLDRLPASVLQSLHCSLEQTKDNTGMILCLAVDYGGRDEIIRACQALAQEVQQGQLQPQEISERLLAQKLYTHDLPDPDLIIRTSGELRLSNFLLWQAAYAEFYFTPVLWPDFSKEHLFQAIEDYNHRERRIGGLHAQK